MITLEAFINKKNLKQSVASNVPKLEYDDIYFVKPDSEDCYKWFDRLEEEALIPDMEYIDRRKVRAWSVRPYGYGMRQYATLVAQLDPSADSHTVFEPILLFAIEGEDDDFIWFCRRGMTHNENRNKEEFEELYNQCERIAFAMGYDNWRDNVNGWIKIK